MTIIKQWLRKEFIEDNIKKVGKVSGVYLLLTEAEYINYVSYSKNLNSALFRHYKIGEIPTKKFTAYQTNTVSSAKKLKRKLINEHEPYYNLFK